jgi:hypothetical protein
MEPGEENLRSLAVFRLGQGRIFLVPTAHQEEEKKVFEVFDVVETIAARIRRVVTKESRKLGLAQPDAELVMVAAIAYALGSPELTGEELRTRFNAELKNNEDDYARNYRRALTEKTLRPGYDKAVKAGVDPVPFLQADLGLTHQEAVSAVADLKRQDEEVAQTLTDDDDWDKVPASPGPAPDVYAGAVPADGTYA